MSYSHGSGRGTLVAIVFVVVVALLVGCAQPAATPSPTPTTAAKPTAAKESKPEATVAKEAKSAAQAATPAKETAKEEKKLVKLTVPYVAVAGSYAPLWITKDRGLFEKYGLDVDIPYIATGTTLIQAMASGEMSLANTGGEGIVAGAVAGSDLLLVAATNNVLAFSLYVQPEIKDFSDLKGKTVGVTKFGSGTDVAARMTLKKFGLEPDKDVAIVQLGGTPETLGAMEAGGIQATVTGPPNALKLKKLGKRELVNISELSIPYVQTGIGISRQFLSKNQDAVRNFLKAYIEGIAVTKKEKDYAMKVLGQYTKTEDKEVLSDTYDYYLDKLLPKAPYVQAASVQTLIDQLARENPKAKDAKPDSFIDNSLVKEIDDSGFIKKLYGE